MEEEPSGARVPNLPALGMSNSYHGEPYIPADIFNVSLCLHLFGPTLWESHSPKFNWERW